MEIAFNFTACLDDKQDLHSITASQRAFLSCI